MPQIFRVSLVKMTYAKIPQSGTAEPFLELRSFVFLDKLPGGVYLTNLRRTLETSIQEMIEKVLPHIFYGREGSFRFDEQTSKAAINVKQLTRFFKVEIDGMEVEQIDLDEMFSERLYWDRTSHDHLLFRRSRIGRILSGTDKLRLVTRRVYRYMAFYDEYGGIKGEYDEGDIQDMLKRIAVVAKRFASITEMFTASTALLEQTTKEIEKAVADLERLGKRFKV